MALVALDVVMGASGELFDFEVFWSQPETINAAAAMEVKVAVSGERVCLFFMAFGGIAG